MSGTTITSLATYRNATPYPFCPGCGHHAILDKLNAEMKRILAQPDIKERLATLAFTPVGDSREQFLIIDGLGEKIDRAGFHRVGARRHIAVAGDQHHRQFRVDGQHLAQDAAADGPGRQRRVVPPPAVGLHLARGGMQVQLSVISRDEMLAAQREPEKHADLLVRIGGYSEYFTRLDRALQDSVIARTEHGLQ